MTFSASRCMSGHDTPGFIARMTAICASYTAVCTAA